MFTRVNCLLTARLVSPHLGDIVPVIDVCHCSLLLMPCCMCWTFCDVLPILWSLYVPLVIVVYVWVYSCAHGVVLCGAWQVNWVYPCLSCLNEVHKAPSASTWACDFTDFHDAVCVRPSLMWSIIWLLLHCAPTSHLSHLTCLLCPYISSSRKCVLIKLYLHMFSTHCSVVVVIVHFIHNRRRSWHQGQFAWKNSSY